MPTPHERTALAFLAALALLAAGVRTVGVRRFEADVAQASGGHAPDDAPAVRALAAQQAAVDSAASAPKRRRSRSRPVVGSRPRSAPQPSVLQPVTTLPPVNVNRASVDELERLPRVGPALAKRIVEWRERHGPFQGLDDLRHVRGIGPSTVRLLDSLVTFSGGHSPLDGEGSLSLAYHSGSVY
jgi:competence ComEA-like helix-hairpin-helix protein